MEIKDLFQQAADHRVIRLRELCPLIGLSPATVYNRINPKSRWFCEAFPKPISLGTGPHCAKGWRLDEVLAYIAHLRHAD